MSEKFLGENIGKLGFGCMRLPLLGDGTVDVEQTKKMVDAFIEKGFTYFDTAYMYLNGTSESTVGEALVKRYPRESFQLATKMPLHNVKETADFERLFNDQLERTGAGYFDFYLLHNLSGDQIDRIEALGGWEFMKGLKESGKAKHIGFSYHDKPDRLEEIFKKHPEAEFVQIQLNYADWDNENVAARGNYEVARKYGKSVIIMEPVKGGSLAVMAPEIQKMFKEYAPDKSIASWAIRYAASLDGLITVLSGMSDESQMADNLATMSDFKPLNDEERAIIAKAVKIMDETPLIACTACRYCTEGCPMNINIPEFIKGMNDYKVYANLDGFKKRADGIKSRGSAMPDECIKCGDCENRCPQNLPIRDLLDEMAELLK